MDAWDLLSCSSTLSYRTHIQLPTSHPLRQFSASAPPSSGESPRLKEIKPLPKHSPRLAVSSLPFNPNQLRDPSSICGDQVFRDGRIPPIPHLLAPTGSDLQRYRSKGNVLWAITMISISCLARGGYVYVSAVFLVWTALCGSAVAAQIQLTGCYTLYQLWMALREHRRPASTLKFWQESSSNRSFWQSISRERRHDVEEKLKVTKMQVMCALCGEEEMFLEWSSSAMKKVFAVCLWAIDDGLKEVVGHGKSVESSMCT